MKTNPKPQTPSKIHNNMRAKACANQPFPALLQALAERCECKSLHKPRVSDVKRAQYRQANKSGKLFSGRTAGSLLMSTSHDAGLRNCPSALDVSNSKRCVTPASAATSRAMLSMLTCRPNKCESSPKKRGKSHQAPRSPCHRESQSLLRSSCRAACATR